MLVNLKHICDSCHPLNSGVEMLSRFGRRQTKRSGKHAFLSGLSHSLTGKMEVEPNLNVRGEEVATKFNNQTRGIQRCMCVNVSVNAKDGKT